MTHQRFLAWPATSDEQPLLTVNDHILKSVRDYSDHALVYFGVPKVVG